MKSLLILALNLFIVYAKENANPGEFPWVVSLQLDSQQGYFGHDCGGAIINEVNTLRILKAHNYVSGHLSENIFLTEQFLIR